jgi:hypothetical protein
MSDSPIPNKSSRLEAANFERAEAAIRMEDDENTAQETGRVSDGVRAGESDRVLDAADRKIKSIEAEP